VSVTAENLEGNLLPVHGTMDDNVHVQNSIRLVDALQRANKRFQFMIYPGSRHGIWASHLRRMRYEFILENLRPLKVPRAQPAGTRRTF
jgi:dipeptidyl-peptidase-4